MLTNVSYARIGRHAAPVVPESFGTDDRTILRCKERSRNGVNDRLGIQPKRPGEPVHASSRPQFYVRHSELSFSARIREIHSLKEGGPQRARAHYFGGRIKHVNENIGIAQIDCPHQPFGSNVRLGADRVEYGHTDWDRMRREAA
jgi:hypothetical protein